ncbi:hypothetical protein DYE49_10605 [Treponema rectale]|uniref:Retron-type reverse transcriptase n=1 Tax=Treponema rectale TaxID=744512 RepID=A0A840SEQ3_9SPIR|nr:reverse transcriptase/maturase family protein [Treponema rectale]MBB5219235.1 retron-type reverse transcriptase [Treponema rectale]QOS40875.1 hypothetical protein DYE49_10605 [Treponema rectale]
MKRADNLFEQITDLENLKSAYLKALKGKRFTPAAIVFDAKADENLHTIKSALESETYVIGNYRQFKIYDPKERLITAASFEDRIVHHAIMNIFENVFEKQFVFHTYACRKGKGTHKAVEYTLKQARQCEYFLKLDIRKYFDNVDHDVLKTKLNRIIKDEKCLRLLFSIIDSYGEGDKQLPIGNLTSQFFANFYLSSMDHLVLEKLKPQGYVRYMDDVIIFDNSKSKLLETYRTLNNYVPTELQLTFKQPVINKCVNGIPFLGFLIRRNSISILSKNWKRKLIKVAQLDKNYSEENEFDTYNRYSSMFACLALCQK